MTDATDLRTAVRDAAETVIDPAEVAVVRRDYVANLQVDRHLLGGDVDGLTLRTAERLLQLLDPSLKLLEFLL
jgi:hypothetical protein